MKNTSKVPCGKVGCAELLFGECNRLKHWKNHGTSASTSAIKSNPTPQTLKTILNNAFSTSLQDSRNNPNDRYNSKENASNPTKPVDKISLKESVGKTFRPFPSNFTMKPLPVPLHGN